jgi:hypothetical protein
MQALFFDISSFFYQWWGCRATVGLPSTLGNQFGVIPLDPATF